MDSEDIDFENVEDITSPPDSMVDMTASILGKVDWFLLFVIAISFLFVISDIYINQLLIKIPDAVQHNEPTAFGSMIQMISQLLFVIMASIVKTYW